jgi:hypothetical protein
MVCASLCGEAAETRRVDEHRRERDLGFGRVTDGIVPDLDHAAAPGGEIAATLSVGTRTSTGIHGSSSAMALLSRFS